LDKVEKLLSKMNEKLFKGSNKWAKDNGKMTSKQKLMNSL